MSPGTQTLLYLLGGIALLLWGFNMLRQGLSDALSWRLRFFAMRARGHSFSAFGVGIGLGTIFQSSTAAVLIAGSLAARGTLSTMQGLSLALGADVGSTLAAQLLALDLYGLSPFFFIGGYVMHRFSKSGGVRQTATAVFGFGLVLIALRLILTATTPLRDSPVMREIFLSLQGEGIVIMLIFALFTWLCHSAIAVVLFISALFAGGAINLESAFYMTLGANLGAPLPAVIASIGDRVELRRIVIGNTLFRVAGVLILMPLTGIFAVNFESAGADDQAVVLYHTFINLITGVGFLLLTPVCGKWLERQLVRVGAANKLWELRYLSKESTPQVGRVLSDAVRETLRMGELVAQMLDGSFKMLESRSRALRGEIAQQDKAVDYLNREIKLFVADIDESQLNEENKRRANLVLSVITHLEHIGDLIDNNLCDVIGRLNKRGANFSNDGLAEIGELCRLIKEDMHTTLGLLVSYDNELAMQLLVKKKEFNARYEQMFHNHLNRLRRGRPETIETSSMHLDLMRDLRRINDHIIEISVSINTTTNL